MLSSPKAAGSTWRFSWKYQYSATNTETSSFAHVMQLLRRDKCGGFVIALDAKKNSTGDYLMISDSVRQCGNACASTKLTNWAGITVRNDILVTFGENGSFDYNITNIAANKRILRYQATGDMGADASIKVRPAFNALICAPC